MKEIGSEGPGTGGRLLIVDDDEQIRRLLTLLLKPLGYIVETVASAEEALEKLRESPPDLVLLDVQLPGRSGHDVLEAIRDEPRTRLLPVVMLTGAATTEEKLKPIRAGVTDFMPNPFSAEELQVHGRDLLQHMRTLTYALPVVYHHHEKVDGSGYPLGLEGDAIPLTARVTTIADIFDALTTERIYRGAISREDSLKIMEDEVRKGWWDRRLLEEFGAVLEAMPQELVPHLRYAR